MKHVLSLQKGVPLIIGLLIKQELLQKYDGETKGIKNGTPVYVELEVIDMGKSDEGFAADYAGVYHVMKINKITVK